MLRVLFAFWEWDWERKYDNYTVTVHTPDTWNLIFIIINSSVLMCRHLSGLPRSQCHTLVLSPNKCSPGSDQCLPRHHHSPNYPNWSCLHMLQLYSCLGYFILSPVSLCHQAGTWYSGTWPDPDWHVHNFLRLLQQTILSRFQYLCANEIFYAVKNVPYNSPAFDTNYLLKHVYKVFFIFYFFYDILYNFNLAELITPDRIYCPPSNVSRR